MVCRQKEKIKIDFLGKAGVEAALRAFFLSMFFRYSNKLDYARYSNLKKYMKVLSNKLLVLMK